MVILKDQPVILLAGTDQFLKEEELAKIKSAFLDEKSKEFNFNVFYGGSSSFQEIWECAYTAPFLGSKRVILVHQFEELSREDQELLLSYIGAPRPETVLVLETSETNFRQNFFSEICKFAQVIFCYPPKDEQLWKWIDAYVTAKGKKIDEKAKKLLVSNLGNDLKLLANSLESLVLYIGKKEIICLGDVQALVGPDVNASVFTLFDALLRHEQTQVFQLLDSLFKDGVNSSQILGALAYKITTEKEKLKSEQATGALEELQEVDAKIKFGRQNQRLALELLLTRLLYLV